MTSLDPPWGEGDVADRHIASSSASRHNWLMPIQFRGKLQDLQDRLLAAGVDGEWNELANQIWQLRCPDGANVNWSSTKGTIWCDGKQAAKESCEREIAQIIGGSAPTPGPVVRAGSPNVSRNVFVVYGHDDKAKTELEAMLRRWDLRPLILDQLTSGGQTIIEKLESVRRDANFGVVLATPDDEGHRREHPERLGLDRMLS